MSQTLGLIAGNGQFPILFARQAKLKNIKIVAAAVKGDTSFWLKFFVDQIQWFGPGELKRLFDFFKNQHIQKVIMAGQVNPKNLFDQHLALDQDFQQLFASIKNRKADTIFSAVASKLEQEGLQLMDSTFLLNEYLAPAGTLTKRGPTLEELQDIEFGRVIAKAMGGLDVGQTVVIKNKAIVAIEAMEGTDQAIVRGGRIAKQGAVVVKTSKPNQDNRFDVPVIGPRTIAHMRRVSAGCLAIEAKKTLVIDRARTVELANKSRICIVGS